MLAFYLIISKKYGIIYEIIVFVLFCTSYAITQKYASEEINLNKFIRRHKGIITIIAIAVISLSALTANWLGLFSVKAAANDHSNIRVSLITMAGKSSVDFTVKGMYSLSGISGDYAFRNGVLLRDGVTYTLKAENGIVKLYIADSGDSAGFELGSDVTLYSHMAGRNYYITMSNPSYGKCNYIGNLRVYVTGNTLNFINDLLMDDYLCGVVAYEMSNGQAVESLKVQAVCARSYAYKAVEGNPNAQYHLVDTQQNQVYKGYNSKYDRVIKAVDETAYQVLTYGGRCIATYYASSNGGLTESNTNAWGSSKIPYLNVNIDEYDKQYQDIEYTLSKTNIHSTMRRYITDAIKSNVQSAGYDLGTLSIVSIDSIVPTYSSQPTSLAETERRIYSLTYTVTVQAKKSGAEAYDTFQQTYTWLRERARVYTYAVRKSDNKAMSIPSTKMKVYDNGDSFLFVVDGRGHGIGMSQHGTYARVAAGQTYSEILNFYFNNTVIKTLQFEPYIYEPIPSNEYIDTQINSVAALETPKVGTIASAAWVHSNAGSIYSRAPIEAGKGVTVVGQSADWYQIIVGDNESSGFVQKSLVKFEDDVVIDNTVGMYELGLTISEVNIRSSAEFIDTNIIGTFPANTQVAIISVGEAFFEVLHNGSSAYIARTEMALSGLRSYAVFDASVTAYKAPVYISQGESFDKIGYLPQNSVVSVFDIGSQSEYLQCVFNGKYAYIKKSDISRGHDNKGYIVPQVSNAVSYNVKITADTGIFSTADLVAENKIADLLVNDVVSVTEKTGSVYKIVYGDATAYISADNARIYSKTITQVIARAKTDAVLYSTDSLESSVGVLFQNSTATLLGENGDKLILSINGGICYASRSNFELNHQELFVFD